MYFLLLLFFFFFSLPSSSSASLEGRDTRRLFMGSVRSSQRAQQQNACRDLPGALVPSATLFPKDSQRSMLTRRQKLELWQEVGCRFVLVLLSSACTAHTHSRTLHHISSDLCFFFFFSSRSYLCACVSPLLLCQANQTAKEKRKEAQQKQKKAPFRFGTGTDFHMKVHSPLKTKRKSQV